MNTTTMHDLDKAERLLGSANDTAIDIAMASLQRGVDIARACAIAAEGFEGKGMAADALTFFDRSLAAAPTLFFSAYGEVGQWPEPQEDAAFDAVRTAALCERDGEEDDEDDEDEDQDEDEEQDEDAEDDEDE